MTIALHNVAKNYKMLPSEALSRATTFDLYVLDVYNQRQMYEQERAESKTNGQAPPVKRNHSTEELLDMLKRARSPVNENSTKK